MNVFDLLLVVFNNWNFHVHCMFIVLKCGCHLLSQLYCWNSS